MISKQSSGFGLKNATRKLVETPQSQHMDHSATVGMMSIQGPSANVSDANQTPNPNNYGTINES
jgi:hypothetical protein